MEYSKEFVMETVRKIRKDNGLSNKEMAELFGFKHGTTISQMACGHWVPEQAAFEKHFGAIEQYMRKETTEPEAVVEVEAVVEPKETVVPVRKTGIVISANSIGELKDMLDILGYKFEYEAV